MLTKEVIVTAQRLVEKGKGILAIDETAGTLGERFKKLKIEPTEENRRNYRRLLCATPDLERFISGVILFDETFRQEARDGHTFPKYLEERGIMPGIKVDTRAWPLAGCPGEQITEGLDGLRDRLQEYRKLGARFCKWRAIFKIGDRTPSDRCITANAHALARYAALCQENDLVPLVEPEVLMNGNHELSCCEAVTASVLQTLFSELSFYCVELEAVVLKANMVIPGEEGPTVTPVELAEATVRCLRRCVPAAILGIVFLSGGQRPVRATENLNAINNVGTSQPWNLSFSFGRALQDEALNTWLGKEANTLKAQELFLHRAQCCSAASLGRYSGKLESKAASQ